MKHILYDPKYAIGKFESYLKMFAQQFSELIDYDYIYDNFIQKEISK